MSWSFSMSGHFEGQDAAEKEAAFVAEMQELTADLIEEMRGAGDNVSTAQFSGQHTGYTNFLTPVVSEPSGVGAGEINPMELDGKGEE